MNNLDFEIRIPEETSKLVIQEEFFWLKQNGTERKVRIHDYVELYSIPHLYECVMNELQAKSHTVLASLLIDQVTQAGGKAADLVVLEVGAGSGMFGKALADAGVNSITGIDILPEAAIAADREYPGVYENYYVEDLTKLSSQTLENLKNQEFNCIVCGSALGFNHITAPCWATAFNLISDKGWVAFNVQKERWEDTGKDSFLGWHPWVAQTDIFEINQAQKYQHRFYMDGRSLEYFAILGRKQADITAQ